MANEYDTRCEENEADATTKGKVREALCFSTAIALLLWLLILQQLYITAMPNSTSDASSKSLTFCLFLLLNMTNQLIGISIICYQTSVFKVWLLPCMVVSIIYGYGTSFSAHLLIKSSLRCKKKAWGDIVMELFGVPQFLIFNAALVFACIVFGVELSVSLHHHTHHRTHSPRTSRQPPNG